MKKIVFVWLLIASAFLVAGCTTTVVVSGEYDPVIDPENFVSVIDNPYYTLTPGTTYTYRAETDEGIEEIVFIVTHEKKEIMGISATVVWDRAFLEGEMIEETYDWFAQDKEGNVWYMGEDSKEYEDGVAVNTHGSWEAGVDGAKPGIIMKAEPKVGDSYEQEYYAGVAEDMADVVALKEKVTVPYGTFDNCLKTKDWSKLDPSLREHKYYCPGVGQVTLETSIVTGEKTELISIETE